ncbi:MAG TPA: amino acid adenylation domain-containing protein, partial [Thermoanaerobaculia bacterium]|nr:amino acid adenylation domain-containing protein [Thermoanaerobaculia bacterium]
TGRPKGAVNTHRGIANRLLWMQELYRLEPGDRVLQKTPVSFDVSVWELFWPLATGARLVLARPGGHQDGTYLLRTIAERRITTLHFVPSMLRVFLDTPGIADEIGSCLKHVIASGEALGPDLERRFHDLFAATPAALHNLYGPTEAAVDVTFWRCRTDGEGEPVPLGRPAANTVIRVLDRDLRAVPAGVAGELAIGGLQLARGYWRRPELTAERFVPDADGEAGQRLYRTGDLARFRSDGILEYLGRIDHQVKLRGFRIELGEIEAALLAHPQVREAAVLLCDDPRLGERLVAYVAPEPGSEPGAGELRGDLGGRLPEHMVPSAFVLLPTLPLTANGKLDRRALSKIEVERGRAESLAPRTPVETALCEIWAGVLGLPRVGVESNFFDLGGHSLLATQVMSRIRQVLGVQLPVRSLFEAPTVAQLARQVEEAEQQAVAKAAARPILPIARVLRDGDLPLSFAQQRLWFIDQLDPGNPTYNIPCALELKGELAVTALRRSFGEVVRRHEVLRTTFSSSTRGSRGTVQRIAPHRPLPPSFMPVVSLAGLPAEVRRAEARRLAAAHARHRFDLRSGPLLKLLLLGLGAREHILLVTLHHIVADGWSARVLLHELEVLYGAFRRGAPSPLPELPIQYVDFAVWQRQWLSGDVLAAQLAYWQNQLAGAPRRLELPTDRPRPAVPSHRGAGVTVHFKGRLSQALAALGQGERATPFMTLLAAFGVLLGRSANQERVLVGTPIANRNRREIEGLIGFFVNTLVLSVDLSGAPTFRQLLGRVRQEALGAFTHQDLPFERLVDAVDPDRDPRQSSLFQVMFALQNAAGEEPHLAGLTTRAFQVSQKTSKFDLTLALTAEADRIDGAVEYSSDLFDARTIERTMRRLETLLLAIVDGADRPISDLPLLSAGERRQLLAWSTGPARRERLPEETLAERFEARVRQSPGARAVTFEGSELTYGELNRRANRLAWRLRELGVGPEERVGLAVERSLDLVVGVLAIGKAGGAYVPLDPSYPRERLAFLAADAGARVVVGSGETLAGLPHSGTAVPCEAPELARYPEDDPPAVTGAENLAYVIYTSGSTGRPKGVLVTHADALRLFRETEPWFGFGPADVWTLFHSYAFDFSVWEIWGALLYGGRLVVVPYLVSRNPESFHDLLAAERVTVLNQTPGAFAQLARVDEDPARTGALPDLRLVIFGGEALEPQRLAPWLRRRPERPRLVNMYGITETTVHVTYRPIAPEDARAGKGSVVGVPIPDLAAYVLDPSFRLAPIGIPGELAIGGAGLARGYLGRPELTAERFVPDAESGRPGARLYRSGDLGRFLATGDLEYLGRIDHQVKIRGFRIELDEIQVALAAHPGVREAVVLPREEEGGERRLVAYVVPRPERPPAVSELRDLLAARLPEYMVPAAFVLLDALPLTANGKVDRKALLALATSRREEAIAYTPPRNEVEGRLVEIFEQVLGVDRVGIDDRFFSIGGDSILSLRIRTLAEERGLRFSLQQLLEHQTARELARRIDPALERQEESAAPFGLLAPRDRAALPAGLEDAYPLSALQTGMLYHSTYTNDSTLYHNVSSLRLAAPFDRAALHSAVAELLARHPILRTSFDISHYGEPIQLVHRVVETPLVIEDLRALPEEEQERRLTAAFAAELGDKFDGTSAPLLRFYVHLLGEDLLQLTWTEHHAILDGWSVAAMIAELFQIYRHLRRPEVPPPPPPPAAAFRDFVALERRTVEGGEARRYWQEKLAGAPRTRLPYGPSGEGDAAQSRRSLSREIDPAVASGLRQLATVLGVPLKSVLLAAHYRALAVLTGQTDLVSALIVNGRPEVQDGERVLGLFLNSVPLRLRLAGGTWLDLVREAAAAEQELFPHRRFPLAQLQQALGGGALFETGFNFVHFHILPRLDDGEVRVLGEHGSADIDLPMSTAFQVDPASAGIYLNLQYDEAVVPAREIERAAGRYLRILVAMAAQPEARYDALSFLTTAELHQVLHEWNDTRVAYPDRRIHELFDLQAAARPEAVAVVAEAGSLTYGEIRRRANRLAHHLRSRGVGPEVPVGLLLERSPEMIMGLLAILKAGGAYVPMDPEYPEGRLAYILADSGARLLLTRAELGRKVAGTTPAVHLDADRETIARQSPADPESPGTPDDLAYSIYTSGSTGLPKGVLVRHASVVNYVVDSARLSGITPHDRGLQFASINFDATVEEIFARLLFGAALVLRDAAMLDSPRRFLAAAGDLALTTLTLPTAYWHEIEAALVDPQLRLPAGLRLIDIGGEKARAEQVGRWQAHGFASVVLINVYGPTEVTVACAHTRLDRPAGREVPVGRPLANTRIYLLGPDLQPLPAGVVGGLFVAGDGLARGYRNQPDLTATAFLPDPWSDRPGARMYRTGDLAVHLPDGMLEFRGRSDDQVKIRGFRIELGEIEAALARHAGVLQSVVVARPDPAGETALVAYLVATGGPLRPEIAELKRFLRGELPAYMVPADFVFLDRLPRTANDKVDRQALPAPERTREDLSRVYLAPRDDLELKLARIWEDLLGMPSVGVRDDFFELGGHSLLAVQLMARIDSRLGRSLPTATLVRNATVERLAAVLRGETGPLHRTALVEMEPGSGRPFFCVHPIGGDVLCYVHLSRQLAAGRAVYGLQVPDREDGARATTVEEMAAGYLQQVRGVQPAGPYTLGGWSMGGIVAFEMARQLESQGETVDRLALIDSFAPGGRDGQERATADGELVALFAHDLAQLFGLPLLALPPGFGRRTAENALGWLAAEAERSGILPPGLDPGELARRFAVFQTNFRAVERYRGGSSAAPLTLFTAAEPPAGGGPFAADRGWGRLAEGPVEVCAVPGNHYTLLRQPHVSALAAALRQRLVPAPGKSEPARAAARHRREVRPVTAEFPLSYPQERLWFLDRLLPDSAVYNIPMVLRLSGRLDLDLLRRAFAELVRRHGGLRTTFALKDGSPVQVVAPPSAPDLPLVDLTGLPLALRESLVVTLGAEDARRPFDLTVGPLLRLTLLRISEEAGASEHGLIVDMHHIVSDGWSMGVFVRELAALYVAFLAGRPSPLPELPLQYADFAVWQRDGLQGEALETEYAYWKEQLAGVPAVTQFPTDRPRPALQRFQGSHLQLPLSPELVRAVSVASRAASVTLFMSLLAALDVLLLRYGGQDDLVVGSPIAGRNRTELEGVIGLFLNTLALRVDAAGDPTVSELLARVRETTLSAFAHQEMPFEKLVEEIAPERNLARAPLFQILLVLQNIPLAPLHLPGFALRPIAIDSGTAKFDLSVNLREEGGGLLAAWHYNRDLFDASTVRRLAAGFERLLGALVASGPRRISELPLLGPAEAQQLREWNATAAAYPEGRRPLPGLLAEQAARTPDSVALVFASASLTYAEMDRRAARLAEGLRRQGVGPEIRVGICAERSLDLVLGLLAILKAGGAYVPLDPSYPAERLAFMLDDADVPVLLTDRQLLGMLPASSAGRAVVLLGEALNCTAETRTEETCPEAAVQGGSAAYVIYTSGSTGQPKGAINSHAGIVNRLLWMQETYRLGPDDRVLQKTPFSFDVSVWELFWPLLTGARLVVARPGGHQDSAYLVQTIRAERITTLHFVPSMLRVFLDAPGDIGGRDGGDSPLRRVMASGEALPHDLTQRFEATLGATSGARLHNLYGPTEAAVDVTWWECEPQSRRTIVPIGRPVANTAIRLLDRDFRAVPMGAAGELAIGGVQLARGYWRRPELTAERFVPDPFAADREEAGARLYRTGDLARWRPEGTLEYLGRIDHQVKIRGFRIELGEIEAALLAEPAVRDGAVVVRADDAGGPRLVAFVVATGAEAPLRAGLQARLPGYMVPAAFIFLPALPLSPNGKVDRKALLALGPQVRESRQEHVPPGNDLERFLAELWRAALGVSEIGIHDNFFALGGNSISGAILINRLQEKLGEIVHVVAIFDQPTIVSLAGYLQGEHAAAVARLWPTAAPAPAAPKTGTDLGDIGDIGDIGGIGGSRVDAARLALIREIVRPAPRVAPRPARAKNPPALFLLSPPRSGSTLLRVMLAGHPRLFAPPELELLSFATMDERKAAFSGRDSFWLEGLLRGVMEIVGCDADAAREIVEDSERAGWTTQRFYAWMQERLDGRTLVDKTPSYALVPAVLARAEEIFEAPLYLHLTRHPYGMIHSFEEAKLEQVFFRYRHPFPRRELAELTWLLSHENVLAFLAGVPAERRHRVRFEDLVTHPAEALQAICRFAGIDYHPDMARPYEKPATRMTDGLHAESRMLGDVKFHTHRRVERKVASSWRASYSADFLGDLTWETAERLGYRERIGTPPEKPETVSLVALNPAGSRPPLFLVHPVGGDVLCYLELTRELGRDQPVYGLQAAGLLEGNPHDRVEDMA